MKKNDLIKILAVTAYHNWLNALKTEDGYNKVTELKVGDVVMEISTLKRAMTIPDKNNYARRIGTLLEINDDSYKIEDLLGRHTYWHRNKNAVQRQMIIIPTEF